MSYSHNRKRRIFLDLDNVIADFIKHFETTFGIHPAEFGGDNDKFWKTFDTKPHGFFRDIPPFEGTRAFVEEVIQLADQYGYDVEVLTAIPKKSIVPTSEREKNEWVMAQKFSKHLKVNIGPYAIQKQNHYKPGDILVDDNTQNIEQWIAKGGVGILHTAFETSMAELKIALAIADCRAAKFYQ